MDLNKQVFVAYAYGLYDKRDYRKIFTDIEDKYDVRFIFADEKITNMHIVQKIISYIKSSDWYICFNPEKTPQDDVISLLTKQSGLSMSEIADFLQISVKLAQLTVAPLLEIRIRVEGKKRGAKYYLV